MLHFIIGSMDGDPNSAVLAVPIDYSKAFNRMLNSNLITIISDLKQPSVPTCAIKLIKSYLTQRSMCVRYKSTVSSFEMCPGGGPQGGLLTGLLFCLQVRKAGSPCELAPSALLPAPTRTQHRMERPWETAPRMEAQKEMTKGLEDGREDTTSEQDLDLMLEDSAGTSPRMDAQEEITQDEESTTREEDEEPMLEPPKEAAPRMEAQGVQPLCHQTDKMHKKSFIDDLTLLETRPGDLVMPDPL